MQTWSTYANCEQFLIGQPAQSIYSIWTDLGVMIKGTQKVISEKIYVFRNFWWFYNIYSDFIKAEKERMYFQSLKIDVF